jgi:sugar phosphate isomerase/epimerase
MYVGLDSFSYHRFFGDISPFEPDTADRWQTTDFLSRACELGVDAVSLQTVFLDMSTVLSLKDPLVACGLESVLAWGHPAGLNGGADEASVEDLLATLFVAKRLGCSLLRFVAGHAHSFKEPAAERIERLLPIVKSVAETAAALDLSLAIENHADFRMADLVSLVERVDMPNLGICFDGLNAVRVGDDLLSAAQLAAPHIRMVHIRDYLPLPGTPNDVEGFWPSVPPGCGQLDISGLINFLNSYGYEGGLFVEIAYMHPDFTDEDKSAAESVAFIKRRLAKTNLWLNKTEEVR